MHIDAMSPGHGVSLLMYMNYASACPVHFASSVARAVS